jgi:hypothetical protein
MWTKNIFLYTHIIYIFFIFSKLIRCVENKGWSCIRDQLKGLLIAWIMKYLVMNRRSYCYPVHVLQINWVTSQFYCWRKPYCQGKSQTFCKSLINLTIHVCNIYYCTSEISSHHQYSPLMLTSLTWVYICNFCLPLEGP